MQVYLDLVMVLNFLVDFLLLVGTNRLAGYPSAKMRVIGAAALGSAYSGVCMLHGFRFLGNTLWRIVSLAGMAGIAFGWNAGAWKRCGIFVLLSMAMGGIAMGFGRGNIPSLLLAAGGVWSLCRIAFGGSVGGREYVPVSITYGEKNVDLIALRDSGNTLTDPITGEPVLVISPDAAEKLTGLTRSQLHSPMDNLRAMSGLRLIPFRTVGCAGGMLLAKRFDNVKIGSRQQSALVAFAAEGLGNGQMYQALTGGIL